MPIRPIGTPTPINTNIETNEQSTKPASKGVGDIPDSFEQLKEVLSQPLIGTMIGNAIGEASNSGEDVPVRSQSANEAAMEGANKQKELIQDQKEPRRPTHSFKRDPD
jgi:hypothetical protein